MKRDNKRHETHGHTCNGGQSKEYRTWAGMIKRCEDTKSVNFGRYGGKGIRVCDRWRQSFKSFLHDMGPRPSSRHSIDRINSNGNYEPDNCRWVTAEEQNTNRYTVMMVSIGDATLSVAQWCRRLSVNAKTVYTRIDRGWNPVKAVTLPIRQRKTRRIYGSK